MHKTEARARMSLPPTPIQSGLGNQHQLTARLERMSQSQLSDISRTPSAQLIRSVGHICLLIRPKVRYVHHLTLNTLRSSNKATSRHSKL